MLGLTASVLIKKVPLERLEKALNALETVMCARLETANDMTAVYKYGARPAQSIVECADEDRCKQPIVRGILVRVFVIDYR